MRTVTTRADLSQVIAGRSAGYRSPTTRSIWSWPVEAAFAPREVARVLRSGGTVLTLQGNPEWRGETLADALGGTPPDWTLPGFGWDVGDSFRQAGLNIVQWTDYTAAVTYHDIGAVVYELLHVPWGVVDFDLNRYRERLFGLHRRMQAEGGFRTRACTNLIEAREAMKPPFVSGLELSAALYAAVEPILQRHFPGLAYAAARIARGSDVLGFDDERSTDHYWGPLLELFVSDADRERWGQQIHDVLAAELPFEVRGYSTHFRPFEGSEAHFGRLGHLVQRTERPINHGVSVMSVRGFFHAWLQVDPLRELEPVEWLLDVGAESADGDLRSGLC